HGEVAGGQVEQGRAELVLAGRGVLLDEADELEGAQDAVGRAAGQSQRVGDVVEAEPARSLGEQAQDGRGPLDRLDGAGHATDRIAADSRSTMSTFVMTVTYASPGSPVNGCRPDVPNGRRSGLCHIVKPNTSIAR